MAYYCRDYDPALWAAERNDEGKPTLVNMTILCEGHGAYEDLDGEGRPIFSIFAFEPIPIPSHEDAEDNIGWGE